MARAEKERARASCVHSNTFQKMIVVLYLILQNLFFHDPGAPAYDTSPRGRRSKKNPGFSLGVPEELYPRVGPTP